MKIFLLIALTLVSYTTSVVLLDSSLDGEWENFKKLHNRNYKDSAEESYRYNA